MVGIKLLTYLSDLSERLARDADPASPYEPRRQPDVG